MSLRRRLVLASGAWLLCGSAGAAGIDTLAACATQVAAEAKGIAALEVQCPGLESALQATGLSAQLPEGWRDTLDRNALGDLSALAQRYRDAPAQVVPDPLALRPILEQLAREQAKPKRSWWDSVREWLRSWFGSKGAGAAPWFDRLLDRLAENAGLVKAIAYGLLGVSVIAAITFIVRELRAAGVLSRRRASAPHQVVAATGRTDEAAPLIADLDMAAPRDQPAILLRLLVARLLANGQLRAARSLTHMELAAQSTFADAQSHTRFARVTQLAERVLYGFSAANATPASVAQADAVIADGRQLLLQLQRPAGETS